MRYFRIVRSSRIRFLLCAHIIAVLLILFSSSTQAEQCIRTGPRCHTRNFQGCCIGSLPAKTRPRPRSVRRPPIPSPVCPSGQHVSSGHCCPSSTDWFPARQQCIAPPAPQPPQRPVSTHYEVRYYRGSCSVYPPVLPTKANIISLLLLH